MLSMTAARNTFFVFRLAAHISEGGLFGSIVFAIFLGYFEMIKSL